MLKWINKKRNKKGFTLVELVVVIAILGILAAIAVPRLSKSRISAAKSAHNANVRSLESAATMAIMDNEPEADVKWNGEDEQGWEEYMQEWPKVSGLLKNADVNFKDSDDETITFGDSYEVEFKGDGSFIITPKKIDLEAEKEDE